MTFVGVPWFVGGGAENPPESARLLANVATKGEQGVVQPTDCRVLSAAVPDGTVRVTPGAVVVTSSKAAASAESYLARNTSDHVAPVTPTGSSSGRSDLVYVRILDPQYVDEPAPASIPNGPYVSVEVAAGVQPGTRTVAQAVAQGVLPAGRTGVALARLDLPAATATVTQAMIVDVRRVTNARSDRDLFVTQPTRSIITSTAWQRFPDVTRAFDVPAWATRATVIVQLSQFVFFGPAATGGLRVRLGDLVGPEIGWDIDGTATSAERVSIALAADFAVPAALRGNAATLSVEGYKTLANMGRLDSFSGSGFIADVQWSEVAAS